MCLLFRSLAWIAVLAGAVQANATIYPAKVRPEDTPVIDGDCAEPAWQNAPQVHVAAPVFRSDVDLSGHKTVLRFVTDGTTLFVSAECRFPPGDNRLPGFEGRRPQPVFENDSLELLFAADGGRTPTPCYHLAIDLCGDTALRKGGQACHSGWKTAVSLAKDRWSAEMAIPLSGIGAEPGAGHYWHVGACRNIYGVNGRFVQTLAIRASGDQTPTEMMLVGPVDAGILAGHVKSALAAIATMRPYLAGPDRALFARLTALAGRLQQKGVPVPVDEAVAILETVSPTDQQIVDNIILNFMFHAEK